MSQNNGPISRLVNQSINSVVKPKKAAPPRMAPTAADYLLGRAQVPQPPAQAPNPIADQQRQNAQAVRRMSPGIDRVANPSNERRVQIRANTPGTPENTRELVRRRVAALPIPDDKRAEVEALVDSALFIRTTYIDPETGMRRRVSPLASQNAIRQTGLLDPNDAMEVVELLKTEGGVRLLQTEVKQFQDQRTRGSRQAKELETLARPGNVDPNIAGIGAVIDAATMSPIGRAVSDVIQNDPANIAGALGAGEALVEVSQKVGPLQPLLQPLRMLGVDPDAIQRGIRQFGQSAVRGFAGGVSSMTRIPQLLGSKEWADLSDAIDKGIAMRDADKPLDDTFFNEIGRTAGGVVAQIAPALITGGSSIGASVAGRMVASAAFGVTEAMSNAASGFDRAVKEGQNIEEARQRAARALPVDMIVSTALNRFGEFSDLSPLWKKMFASSFTEGLQETFQTGLEGYVATGELDFTSPEAIKGGLLGMILGPLMGGGIDLATGTQMEGGAEAVPPQVGSPIQRVSASTIEDAYADAPDYGENLPEGALVGAARWRDTETLRTAIIEDGIAPPPAQSGKPSAVNAGYAAQYKRYVDLFNRISRSTYNVNNATIGRDTFNKEVELLRDLHIEFWREAARPQPAQRVSANTIERSYQGIDEGPELSAGALVNLAQQFAPQPQPAQPGQPVTTPIQGTKTQDVDATVETNLQDPQARAKAISESPIPGATEAAWSSGNEKVVVGVERIQEAVSKVISSSAPKDNDVVRLLTTMHNVRARAEAAGVDIDPAGELQGIEARMRDLGYEVDPGFMAVGDAYNDGIRAEVIDHIQAEGELRVHEQFSPAVFKDGKLIAKPKIITIGYSENWQSPEDDGGNAAQLPPPPDSTLPPTATAPAGMPQPAQPQREAQAPTQPVAQEATQKEPWQMGKAEYVESIYRGYGLEPDSSSDPQYQQFEGEWEDAVRKAYAAGKPVPAENMSAVTIGVGSPVVVRGMRGEVRGASGDAYFVDYGQIGQYEPKSEVRLATPDEITAARGSFVEQPTAPLTPAVARTAEEGPGASIRTRGFDPFNTLPLHQITREELQQNEGDTGGAKVPKSKAVLTLEAKWREAQRKVDDFVQSQILSGNRDYANNALYLKLEDASESAGRAYRLKREAEIDAAHYRAVEQALKRGLPVPPEVLADYPDLAAKYQPQQAEPQMPTREQVAAMNVQPPTNVPDMGALRKVAEGVARPAQTETPLQPAEFVQPKEVTGRFEPVPENVARDIASRVVTKKSTFDIAKAEGRATVSGVIFTHPDDPTLAFGVHKDGPSRYGVSELSTGRYAAEGSTANDAILALSRVPLARIQAVVGREVTGAGTPEALQAKARELEQAESGKTDEWKAARAKIRQDHLDSLPTDEAKSLAKDRFAQTDFAREATIPSIRTWIDNASESDIAKFLTGTKATAETLTGVKFSSAKSFARNKEYEDAKAYARALWAETRGKFGRYFEVSESDIRPHNFAKDERQMLSSEPIDGHEWWSNTHVATRGVPKGANATADKTPNMKRVIPNPGAERVTVVGHVIDSASGVKHPFTVMSNGARFNSAYFMGLMKHNPNVAYFEQADINRTLAAYDSNGDVLWIIMPFQQDADMVEFLKSKQPTATPQPAPKAPQPQESARPQPATTPKPELAPDTARMQAQKQEAAKARQSSREESARRKSAEGFAALPERSRAEFDKRMASNSVDDIASMLHPSNKSFRAEFERRTGVTLPSTVSGTKQAIADWLGVEVPTKQAAPKMSKEEAFAKAKEARAESLLSKPLEWRDDNNVDRKTTAKEYGDWLLESGYRPNAAQITDFNTVRRAEEVIRGKNPDYEASNWARQVLANPPTVIQYRAQLDTLEYRTVPKVLYDYMLGKSEAYVEPEFKSTAKDLDVPPETLTSREMRAVEVAAFEEASRYVESTNPNGWSPDDLKAYRAKNFPRLHAHLEANPRSGHRSFLLRRLEEGKPVPARVLLAEAEAIESEANESSFTKDPELIKANEASRTRLLALAAKLRDAAQAQKAPAKAPESVSPGVQQAEGSTAGVAEPTAQKQSDAQGPSEAAGTQFYRRDNSGALVPAPADATAFKSEYAPNLNLFTYKLTVGSGRAKTTSVIIADARTGFEITRGAHLTSANAGLKTIVDSKGEKSILARIEQFAAKYGEAPQPATAQEQPKPRTQAQQRTDAQQAKPQSPAEPKVVGEGGGVRGPKGKDVLLAPVVAETDRAVQVQVRFVNKKAKSGKRERFESIWIPKSMISNGLVDSKFLSDKLDEALARHRQATKYAASFDDWRLDSGYVSRPAHLTSAEAAALQEGVEQNEDARQWINTQRAKIANNSKYTRTEGVVKWKETLEGAPDSVKGTDAYKSAVAEFNELFGKAYMPINLDRQSPDILASPSKPAKSKDTITVDGKERPRTNSNGQPIHPTEEGIRAFWKWFGDSQVVDEQGRPLVVYHGTNNAFDTFAGDTGFFFSDTYETAEGYSDNGTVISAYLKANLPLSVDAEGRWWMEASSQFQDGVFLVADTNTLYADAIRAGNDSLIVRNVVDEGDEGRMQSDATSTIYVVQSPTQIKSAISNQGTFSPDNPSILASPRRVRRGMAPEPIKWEVAALPYDGPSIPLSDLRIDLEQAFGKLRTGTSAKGTKGVYVISPDIKYVRYGNDVVTAAHEIAHQLDARQGITNNIAGPALDQLRSGYFDRTIPENASQEVADMERFAVLVEAYVSDPERLKALTPELFGWMEKILPPKSLTALQNFSTKLRQYAGQSATAKASSSFVMGRQVNPVQRTVENIKAGSVERFTDNLTQGWLDQYGALLRSVDRIIGGGDRKEGARKRKENPLMDWEVALRDVPYTDEMFTAQMQEGFIDRRLSEQTGSVVTAPSFVQLVSHLEPGTDKFEENYRKATAYMNALRHLDWADRKKSEAEANIEAYTDAVNETKDAAIAQKRLDLMTKAVENGASNVALAIKPELDAYTKRITSIAKQKITRFSNAERKHAIRMGEESGLVAMGPGIKSTVEEARRALKELEPDMKMLRAFEKDYRALSDYNLNMLVWGGRLTPDQAATIRANNPHWFAVIRIDDREASLEEVVRAHLRPTRSIFGARNLVHSFQGSQRTKDDPLAALATRMRDVMQESHRNRALAQMTYLLKNAGFADGMEGELNRVRLEDGIAPTENQFTIWVNGEKQVWEVSKENSAVLQSMRAISMQSEDGKVLEAILKVLSKPASITRNLIINAPPFIVRNLTRDTIHRMTMVENFGPGAKVPKQSGLAESMGVGLGRSTVFEDPDSFVRRQKDALNDLTSKGHIVLRGRRAYQNLRESAEMVNRKAVFDQAYRAFRASGYNEYQATTLAAYAARESMTDFKKIGSKARALSQIIPFFSAQIAGTSTSMRQLGKNPAQVIKKLTVYSAVLVGLEQLWAALGGDDEEKELERLNNLDRYQRELFWNFRVGGDDGFWLSIPKGHEQSIYTTMVGQLAASLNEGRFGKPDSNRVPRAFVDNLLPVSTLPDAFGGWLPLVELVFNKKMYNDREVVPDHERNKEMSRRNIQYASPIGKALHGFLGVDARQWDYALEEMTGYYGRAITGMAEAENPDDAGRILLRFTGLNMPGSPTQNENVIAVDNLLRTFGKRPTGWESMKKAFFNAKTEAERQRAGRALVNRAKIVRERLEAWKPLPDEARKANVDLLFP